MLLTPEPIREASPEPKTASASCVSTRSALKCRRMVEADIDNAVDLLSAGFPERSPAYWRRGLLRLRDRPLPDGYPRFGYVLADGAVLVGIILVLFSQNDAETILGNVSSWYVDPAYRSFSHLLLSTTLKLKGVTLFNISPAPSTIETIGAQGFTEYVAGSHRALAALAAPVIGAKVRRVVAGESNSSDINSILAAHAAWGSLAFEVTHRSETHPFVFQPCRFMSNRLRCAQLVYCKSVETFTRFAGPLGRRLLRHGLWAVLVDANAPIAGLPGIYRPGHDRKFFRGPAPPRIGDLTYSEFVVFGP